MMDDTSALTILIVDDSATDRAIIRGMLGEYKTISAADGREAMDILERQPDVDLVILDLNMPVMDGYEFLRNLRMMPGGDKPKVVFCTTENDLAHIQEAMSAGADEYIMKPFDGDIIQSKFSQVGLL